MRLSKLLFVPLVAGITMQCAKAQSVETPEKAVEIANEYVKANFPASRLELRKPFAADTGNSWTVTYRLPEGAVGGSPIVVIQKSDGVILSSRAQQ